MVLPTLAANSGGVGPNALLVPLLKVTGKAGVNGKYPYDQVAAGARGRAYRYAKTEGQSGLYREEDGGPFWQCVPVDKYGRDTWAVTAQQVAEKLNNGTGTMLEIVSREARGSMVCNVLSPLWQHPAEIIIGDKGYDYEHYARHSAFHSFLDGKPCYVSFGVGLWEVENMVLPVGTNQPLRIEIVGKRRLFSSGPDSVLIPHGLEFIADETNRKEQTTKIQRIENQLQEMEAHSILDCAVVAEELLYYIGKQRLLGGKSFGQFDAVAKLEEQPKAGIPQDELQKYREARLHQLAQSFVEEFGKLSLVKREMKWMPSTLHLIREWGNYARHAVIRDSQLLKADGFTAVACYGSLRDFIRLLQHIHQKEPGEICPAPQKT